MTMLLLCAPYAPLLPCRLSQMVLVLWVFGRRVGLLTAIKLVDFSNEESAYG